MKDNIKVFQLLTVLFANDREKKKVPAAPGTQKKKKVPAAPGTLKKKKVPAVPETLKKKRRNFAELKVKRLRKKIALKSVSKRWGPLVGTEEWSEMLVD